MSAKHPRAVANLIRSLIPVACPDRGAGLDDYILAHTAASVGAAPVHIRTALHAAAIAYDLGAIVYPGVGMSRAHRLGEADRERYFRAWHESPLAPQREFTKAVKGFICLAYYEHPQTRAKLDYDPEGWIDKVRARRLATYSADIEAHEKALREPDPLPRGFFERRAESSPIGSEVDRAS